MYNSYLAHHGVLGMKWGVRRYQNEDGSLTSAGEKRYGVIKDLERKSAEHQKKEQKRYDKSAEGKLYKEWKKKNPNADEDDFGDYLLSKKTKSFEKRDNEYERDLRVLKKKQGLSNFIGNMMLSAVYVAPLTSLVSYGVTRKGKVAARTYLATMGIMSVASIQSSVKEYKEVEKKYGLRD